MKALLPPVFAAMAAALLATTSMAGSSVSVSVTPATISEEGEEAVYTITATPGSQQRLVVSFVMTGTASLSSDYILMGDFNEGRIVIPAGQPSTTVTLHALSDEPDGRKFETATMNILNGRQYHVGSPRSATVKITQPR
jgi:hypothetical protein